MLIPASKLSLAQSQRSPSDLCQETVDSSGPGARYLKYRKVKAMLPQPTMDSQPEETVGGGQPWIPTIMAMGNVPVLKGCLWECHRRKHAGVSMASIFEHELVKITSDHQYVQARTANVGSHKAHIDGSCLCLVVRFSLFFVGILG